MTANGASNTTYANVRHKKIQGKILLTSDNLIFESIEGTDKPTRIVWNDVLKHQVSPVTHPKALLKILRKDGKPLTFTFSARNELDRIRKDITSRLQLYRAITETVPSSSSTTNTRKRKTFGEIDATALAVTRSSILSSNPTLREQHQYLVTETQTVTEDDFWATHQSMIEEEYAKICGTTRAGTSSLMQSHLPLQGKVTLGVEEMRQIFILYPAVHKAYEEKVPLELSDEQFWRKYLESEYFHRDRGRIGTAARNQQQGTTSKNDKSVTASGKSVEEEDARAAAVGSDDLFSRYDAKLRDESNSNDSRMKKNKDGTKLAVGQFDLASTVNTERGHLLEGPKDLHPPNTIDDGKGSRVIQKYNRHWTMVLFPDSAVAGSNLTDIARKSVDEVLDGDDAKVQGGIDEEMRRLVEFADASEEDANHVQGLGEGGFEELTLKNVEVYAGEQKLQGTKSNETEEAKLKRQAFFARVAAQKMQAMPASLLPGGGVNNVSRPNSFPDQRLGTELLMALTKKMAADSKTEEDALAVVNELPEEFKKRLHAYFLRTSELLRHFYGLRKVEKKNSGSTSQNNQKLARIVKGLEAVYREMEIMRKELPETEIGLVMRKMCKPIMGQLDEAFKLHRSSSTGGGGGWTEEIL